MEFSQPEEKDGPFWLDMRGDFVKELINNKKDLLSEFFLDLTSKNIYKFLKVPEKVVDLIQKENQIIDEDYKNDAIPKGLYMIIYVGDDYYLTVLVSEDRKKLEVITDHLAKITYDKYHSFHIDFFPAMIYLIDDDEETYFGSEEIEFKQILKQKIIPTMMEGINVSEETSGLAQALRYSYEPGTEDEDWAEVIKNQLGIDPKANLHYSSPDREKIIDQIYQNIIQGKVKKLTPEEKEKYADEIRKKHGRRMAQTPWGERVVVFDNLMVGPNRTGIDRIDQLPFPLH